MATLKQCDRCGKICSPVYFLRYQVGHTLLNNEPAFGERDLCVNCKNELLAFMRGEQVNRVEKQEMEVVE